MLRFRQKKIIAVFVLLSLSLNSFAESGFKEKTSTNLVELFKVKAHATDHIKGIEAKLLATDEADQEELLVELAQSLLYYQDRHNKEPYSKMATSKSVRSHSTSGEVSKVVSSKGPFSTNKIYHKALNAYKKAAKLSLNKSRIKYTRELSELAVKLKEKDELVQIFNDILQHGGDENGTYLAHIDYADGLAQFEAVTAEAQFLSAINLRSPVDGIEANYRYANYLLDKNKPLDALGILDKYTFEEKRKYPHIATLRQLIMHRLKLDTREVDDEIRQLRKLLSKTSFLGAMLTFSTNIKKKSSNTLGFPVAFAFAFAHNNESDDSRGRYSDSWVVSPNGFLFSTSLINAAEVIYNVARGETYVGRSFIAWAIRNRATINMNGCDFYPGAEGHSMVSACRSLTPSGPQPSYIDSFKSYSCVIHGGTVDVGANNTQMNDAHVPIEQLESSGILWELFHVMNGWVPDPSGYLSFTPATYPSTNVSSGNPKGVQEWRLDDECPDNQACKISLGTLFNELLFPQNLCSSSAITTSHRAKFWARKATSTSFDLKDMP